MSYPCTNPDLDPEDRFYVHLAEHGSNEYIINDIDLELFPRLPTSLLEDPSFNLVTWYREYIDETNTFELQYSNTHPGHSGPKVACPDFLDYMCGTCSGQLMCQLGSCSFASTKHSTHYEGDKCYPEVEFEYDSPDESVNDVPDLQTVSDSEEEQCSQVLDNDISKARGAYPDPSEQKDNYTEPGGDDFLGSLDKYYLGSVGDVLINQLKTVLT